MKLLLATLLSTSSLLIASCAEAQCRNGWFEAGCTRNDECLYVKFISGNYPYVTYWVNSPSGKFKVEADCQQFKSRNVYDSGDKGAWNDAMHGTLGGSHIETASGM